MVNAKFFYRKNKMKNILYIQIVLMTKLDKISHQNTTRINDMILKKLLIHSRIKSVFKGLANSF
jgi:GTP-binding protein EngB required for normal cell division